MSTPTFPRWRSGGPRGSLISAALLREVAPGLFVGSAHAAALVAPNALVIQFSGRADSATREHVLMRFEDGAEVPASVLERAVELVAQHRGLRPVLLQCYAGLSRSASIAYAVLRRIDGLTHEEALARVEHVQAHYDRTERWPNPDPLASVVAWCNAVELRPTAVGDVFRHNDDGDLCRITRRVEGVWFTDMHDGSFGSLTESDLRMHWRFVRSEASDETFRTMKCTCRRCCP